MTDGIPGSVAAKATIDPIRGAVILIQSFGRNLAYYRASLSPTAEPLLDPQYRDASFWRQVHSNFVDMLVLEWCKLFGDTKSHYYWGRALPKGDLCCFEKTMLAKVCMTRNQFDEYVKSMVAYRNWFVAHLSKENDMHIPHFEVADTAADHYHCHLARIGLSRGRLGGLASSQGELRVGRELCKCQAHRIYSAASGADSVPH